MASHFPPSHQLCVKCVKHRLPTGMCPESPAVHASHIWLRRKVPEQSHSAVCRWHGCSWTDLQQRVYVQVGGARTCGLQNDPCINVGKTKEIDVERLHPPPLYIGGAAVERVSTCEYLGLHISSNLKWATNTASIIKKAHQHPYFLRRLKRAVLSPAVLTSFYWCVVESTLTSSITVWYANSSVAHKKAVQGVVKFA